MSNPTQWQDLLTQLTSIKDEFNRSYKCLNKTKLPSANTQAKHLNNLVLQHNSIAATLRTFYPLLTPHHKEEVENLFANLKSKLAALLKKFEISDKVPDDFTSVLNLRFTEVEESDSSDNSTTTTKTPANNNKPKTMPLTQAEFINLATKVLPDFNGEIENLQKFLNALDILNSIKESHETLAVQLIKTKLTQKAQKLITSETTISDIQNTLKSKVKGETSIAASTKLLSAKQNSKSGSDFIKEIQDLANKLENAYISDGMSANLAQTFTTQTVVKALTKNAKSEKVKTVMLAGKFDTLSEVTTKFVEVNTDVEEQKILFMRKRNDQNRNSYNNDNMPQNRDNRNISTVEPSSENGTTSQTAHLGMSPNFNN